MFLLISSMEIVVKNHIALNASLVNFSMKDELSSKIISNEEVEYYWDILWAEKEGEILLSLIVDHRITVRGFAYTSAWMERYKSITHKTIQKSKGIRKTLVGSTSTVENNVG